MLNTNANQLNIVGLVYRKLSIWWWPQRYYSARSLWCLLPQTNLTHVSGIQNNLRGPPILLMCKAQIWNSTEHEKKKINGFLIAKSWRLHRQTQFHVDDIFLADKTLSSSLFFFFFVSRLSRIDKVISLWGESVGCVLG